MLSLYLTAVRDTTQTEPSTKVFILTETDLSQELSLHCSAGQALPFCDGFPRRLLLFRLVQ